VTWNLYIKLAWRNVLRNKRRTMIAGTAVALGLAALMFVDALHLSMQENMIDAATASFLGEGQIANKNYRKSLEIGDTVRHLSAVLEELRHDPRVLHFTTRTFAFAMLASPSNVSAVQLVGVDPGTERYLSEIDDRIVKGSFFSGDDPHDIVVGAKLAELLEVGIGDRVVITTAQAHTGELAQEMFRISGIYFFNAEELDGSMAIVRISQAQKVLNLDHEVHQIALKFKDRDLGRRRDDPFWAAYSRDGNEAVGWADLVPQLEKVFRLSKIARIIVFLILFGVVALGIVNTLFMSLYERMFEFGVLRAVGTRPFSMGRIVVLEAGALTVISIVLGCVLGAVLIGVTNLTGIDFSGIEYEGVTFTKALYPVWHVQQFTVYPVLFFIFASLVALYPAMYAARLTPAQAMRKSF
jgi:ABC-type lipoprotein release transport system permease subunit